MQKLVLAGILVVGPIVSAQTQNPTNTPAATQAQQEYRPTTEEAELIRLSRDWMDAALVRSDEKKLRELMNPAFTLQIFDASRAQQSLEEWMRTRETRLKDIKFEYLSISARVFGRTGVVYSTFRWSGQLDGKPFKDAGVMVDVWERRNGTWKVVSRRSAGQHVLGGVSKSLDSF